MFLENVYDQNNGLTESINGIVEKVVIDHRTQKYNGRGHLKNIY